MDEPSWWFEHQRDALFVQEISWQAAMLVESIAWLEALLASGQEPWVAIQSTLVCGANVAKLFWGSGDRGRRDARLERVNLRDVFDIDDQSPIFNVDLRNDLEHMDERILDWNTREGDRRALRYRTLDGQVQPFHQNLAWLHLDRSTRQLMFLGRTVDLRALEREARRILERCGVVQAELTDAFRRRALADLDPAADHRRERYLITRPSRD